MSLVDPRDHSARMVGRTPWTARDAPVPRPGQRYEHLEGCQLADGGVGRGPGLHTNPAAFHLLGSLGGAWAIVRLTLRRVPAAPPRHGGRWRRAPAARRCFPAVRRAPVPLRAPRWRVGEVPAGPRG